MRMIAISIAIMAGAVMAGAGAIAEGSPNSRRLTDVDEIGMTLAGLSFLLLVIEFIKGFSRPSAK